MTKEDIIKLAREAGFFVWTDDQATIEGYGEDLERFAQLVAAAEREACAKVCETQWSTFPEHRHGYDLAASIRARGKVTKGKENHA